MTGVGYRLELDERDQETIASSHEMLTGAALYERLLRSSKTPSPSPSEPRSSSSSVPSKRATRKSPSGVVFLDATDDEVFEVDRAFRESVSVTTDDVIAAIFGVDPPEV